MHKRPDTSGESFERLFTHLSKGEGLPLVRGDLGGSSAECEGDCSGRITCKAEKVSGSRNDLRIQFVDDIPEGDTTPINVELEEDNLHEQINHPEHYNTGRIEVYDFLRDQKLPYPLANAVKYIARCRFKGQKIEDIKKAIWYLERYIEESFASDSPYHWDEDR